MQANKVCVPAELATRIAEKASRFAASPREGYLAGLLSPHTKPSSPQLDDRLARVRHWSDKLAWLYAVAQQDLPAGHYQWGTC